MNNQVVRETRFRLSDAGGQMQDYGPGASTIWQDAGMLQGVTPVAELDAAIKGYVDGRGSGGPTTDLWSSWGTNAQGFGWTPTGPPWGVGFAVFAPAARGICRVTPVFVGARAITIGAMAVLVNTAQAATLVRLGLFSLSDQTLAPLALLGTAGTADTTGTGAKVVAFSTAISIPVNTLFVGVGVMLEGAALGALTFDGNASAADFDWLGKADIDANSVSSWANASSVGDGALPDVSTLTTIVAAQSSGWLRRDT